MTDQRTDPDEDPILPVWRLVRSGERPSLPWVVRWSAAGWDPLQAAWLASEAWREMMFICGWEPYDEPWLQAQRGEVCRPLIMARMSQLKTCVRREILGLCDPLVDVLVKPAKCLACAEAIRSQIPELPLTLAELIEQSAKDDKEPTP